MGNDEELCLCDDASLLSSILLVFASCVPFIGEGQSQKDNTEITVEGENTTISSGTATATLTAAASDINIITVTAMVAVWVVHLLFASLMSVPRPLC